LSLDKKVNDGIVLKSPEPDKLDAKEGNKDLFEEK